MYVHADARGKVVFFCLQNVSAPSIALAADTVWEE